MKKKMFLGAAIALLAIGSAATLTACGNDVLIEPEQMPKKSQQMSKELFPDCEIVKVEYDNDDDDYYNEKDYDVTFSCGVEVEFNKDGEWMSIKCLDRAVPESILPIEILDLIKADFKDNYIVEIEKEKNDGFEIELDNDIEIEFDKDFKIIAIDCKTIAVPEKYITPATIVEYVKANYANNFIVAYEQTRTGFEVELDNKVELIFDKEGAFVRIDD